MRSSSKEKTSGLLYSRGISLTWRGLSGVALQATVSIGHRTPTVRRPAVEERSTKDESINQLLQTKRERHVAPPTASSMLLPNVWQSGDADRACPEPAQGVPALSQQKAAQGAAVGYVWARQPACSCSSMLESRRHDVEARIVQAAGVVSCFHPKSLEGKK